MWGAVEGRGGEGDVLDPGHTCPLALYTWELDPRHTCPLALYTWEYTEDLGKQTTQEARGAGEGHPQIPQGRSWGGGVRVMVCNSPEGEEHGPARRGQGEHGAGGMVQRGRGALRGRWHQEELAWGPTGEQWGQVCSLWTSQRVSDVLWGSETLTGSCRRQVTLAMDAGPEKS